VRGPNAATYGANAFLAVINIITKDPSQTPGTFASLQHGEQGMSGVTLRHGGSRGDLRYRMTLSAQNRDRFETTVPDGAGSLTQYEETRTYFLNGRADYRASASDEVTAQFGLAVGDWQAGRLQDPPDPEHELEPRQQDVSNAYLQFKFRRVLSADDEWSLQFYHSRHALDAPSRLEAFGLTIVGDQDTLQTRTSLEFQANTRLGPALRMAWGAEVRRETAQSLLYFDTRDTQQGVLGRVNANLEWHARPDLLLQAGAMLEHHYFTGTDVSPRVAVNYTLADGHTLRLNVSQAYRSPTFFEQQGSLAYYSTGGALIDQVFVPSDPLRPERILSREIAYVGQYPALRMQFDAKLFRDTIHDYIGGAGSPRQFTNRDAFTVQGGDLQLNWQPVPALRLSAQYARAFIAADPSVDRDLSQSVPHNNFSLLARYDLGQGWNASAGVYRSGRMKWLSDGDITQAYTRWDVRLARRWSWQGHEVEAAVVGQNLGEDYSEFRSENVFSRRVYGSLSLDW